jgi:hypothetical protein
VFRVDAEGVTAVEHSVRDGVLQIQDKASRVAVYVASAKVGERARLESRRAGLLSVEQSIDFNPAQREEDLAVLRAMLQAKSK